MAWKELERVSQTTEANIYGGLSDCQSRHPRTVKKFGNIFRLQGLLIVISTHNIYIVVMHSSTTPPWV